ncbi:MAG TPA: ABC transporter permease [Gemmatimonadales bacterium]|jgi:putative ABC transport system permease protein|nr:ABC transporter permease [Gemmatimonadales bacterium]
MDTLIQDLRYAVRTLAKAPGFAAVAILTLAIGIGANTAIFSAIDTVLLRPLPFPDGDRLVQINTSGGIANAKFGISYPDLVDLRGLTTVFSGVGGSTSQRYNLTGAGDPLEVEAASVSADLFPVLGVTPQVGRLFSASDERAPVALISYGLWVTSFGSDPKIVGKPIALDGKSYTVVGVMPAGFQYPQDNIRVWTPVGDALEQNPGAETNRDYHFFTAVGRLGPKATFAQAVAALDVLSARINAADSANPSGQGGGGRRQMIGISINGPGTPPGAPNGGQRAALLTNTFAATPLHDVAIGDTRRPLFILFGAVALVLLIACVNAANLLLARATARRREMALRQALGAARGRLVRQLLTESVLLSLSAAVVGSLLALWGIRALVSIWPRALPGGAGINVDWRILAFTFGLALITGLVFGLIPAWRASAPQIEETLREDSAGTTGSRRRRLQGGLVIAEITVALVLLVGAGLLVKSFIRLSNVNPGFATSDLLAARVRLTPTRYASGPAQAQFFDQMLTSLSSRPGIQSASIAGTLPWSGSFRMLAFDPRTIKPDYPDPFMVLGSYVVSPDYFSAFRIPIRRGRAFTADDRAGAPAVAIVNRATVKALWPDQDPIGKQITLGRPGGPRGITVLTVVGAIDDIRSAALDATPRPEIYTPAAQEKSLDQMWVVFRASNGKPLQMASAIRDAVHQADPEQPIGEIASLSEMGDRLTAARRFNTSLLTLFALLAVALSMVGIYGVTSYAVTQRTRELGIRLALGAQPGQVVGLLVRENLSRVAIGVVLGIGAAFGVTWVLKSLLFEVSSSDAVTFGSTAGLLAAVALAATWWPARRATRVDPMIALRAE